MLWCGNMTLLFVLGLFQCMIEANVHESGHRLSAWVWFWGMGYLVYLAIHTIWLI